MSFTRIFLFALCFSFPFAQANANLPVQYAGFSYVGDYKHIKSNYPYSLKLNEIGNSGQPYLDGVLLKKIKNITPDHFSLIFEKLSDMKSGESIAMAFSLDREDVSVERINGNYKLLITLSAQALFFDFNEKTIIGSFPINVQYTDVLRNQPSEAFISNTVKDLYSGELGVNIFDEFTSMLSTLKVQRKYNNRIQVSDVIIEEKAISYLPDYFSEKNGNFKSFISSAFSTYLSNNQNVSVLPYVKGYAIGNKMSARFSNGEIYNLVIPEADYNIEITIRGFKKVVFDKRAAGTSAIYGSYINFKMYEPLSGKVYINSRLKNGATKIIPNSQDLVDDWPAFQESLLVLFNGFTNQISKASDEWIEEHSGNTSLIDELIAMNEVVKKCQ